MPAGIENINTEKAFIRPIHVRITKTKKWDLPG
jgi:hypothetical protein